MAARNWTCRPGRGRNRRRQRAATAEIARCEKSTQEIREAARKRLLESGNCKLPADAVQAFLLEAAKRSDEQKKLVQTYAKELEREVSGALTAGQTAEIAANQDAIEALRRATPDLPRGVLPARAARRRARRRTC